MGDTRYIAPMLFADAILNDRAINIFNNGDMSRDFTYIDDIINGCIKVIDNPNRKDLYQIYNIGNNAPVQLMDFIKALENSLGKEVKKEYLPIKQGNVKSTYADISGLINDFDYKPDTSIQHGVDGFVEWYREFYRK